MARVDTIHAQIEDAHAKIFEASSESSLHPTSEEAAEAEAEMLADDAAMEAMEPLPHEIAERKLEMQEAAESNEHREEELCVAKEEVEKRLSIKESAMIFAS